MKKSLFVSVALVAATGCAYPKNVAVPPTAEPVVHWEEDILPPGTMWVEVNERAHRPAPPAKQTSLVSNANNYRAVRLTAIASEEKE